MLLDIGVTSGMQLKQIIELMEVAEKSGLNNVWIGEDIPAPYDVFTVASIILLKSSKMNAGIGITSPLIRNISTIARASVSLTETGGDNRFRLGLGIGGFQDLAKLGITVMNPAGIMRNATALLRRIWRGEALSFENGNFVLKQYYTRYGLGYQIPIFFGVRGPKLLKLAGEIADGIILSGPKTYLKKAISTVREGIQESNQPSRNFTFVAWVPTIVTEKKTDLNLVKRSVAFVLADTPKKVLEMANLNYEEIEGIKLFSRRYGMAKASQLVTEDLIEELAIHGNARQVCETSEYLEKLGVQEVVFGPPYGPDLKKAATKLAQAWRRFG